MTKTIIINVNELNTQWLAEMQAQHSDALLEIKVLENSPQPISEADFWTIIDSLDWAKENATNAIIRPAINQLKAFEEAAIFKFQDLLAEKLYALDRQVFAENMGKRSYGGAGHFSVDGFLYTRACVVANGRDFYESVLLHPNKIPKEFTFEVLLHIAATAYEEKTGKTWAHLPTPSYETYSNSEGWGGKNWMNSILNI